MTICHYKEKNKQRNIIEPISENHSHNQKNQSLGENIAAFCRKNVTLNKCSRSC